MKEWIDHRHGSRFCLKWRMKNSNECFYTIYTAFTYAHVIQSHTSLRQGERVYVSYCEKVSFSSYMDWTSSIIDDCSFSRFFLISLSSTLTSLLCNFDIKSYFDSDDILLLYFQQIIFAQISTIQVWNKWICVWRWILWRKNFSGTRRDGTEKIRRDAGRDGIETFSGGTGRDGREQSGASRRAFAGQLFVVPSVSGPCTMA